MTAESEHFFKKKPCQRNHPQNARNKIDSVDATILHALENPEAENRDVSFFRCIIPSLSAFDEEEILQRQMDILQLISNIKKQKKSGTLSWLCT